MRASNHPNRRNRGRLVFLVAGSILLAIALGAVAVAGTNKKPPRAQQAVAPSAYAEQIRKKLGELKRLEKGLSKLAISAGAKKSSQDEVSFPFGAAADGQYVYWFRLTVRLDVEDRYTSKTLRLKLFRTDRSTGVEQKLLDKYNAFPISLQVRGGTIAMQTIGLAGRAGPQSIRSVIYKGSTAEETIGVADVAKIRLSGDEDEFCSDFRSLIGIALTGEPVVTAVTAECPSDSKAIFSANHWLWKHDGSKQDLGIAAANDLFFSGSALIGGSKLVTGHPFARGVAITDINSLSRSSLWAPGPKSFDVSSGGSVALVGRPPSNSFEEPGRQQNYPFVLFPAGDADAPKVIAPSLSRAEGVRFCGSNLYLLVRDKNPRPEFGGDDGSENLFFGVLNFYFPGNYQVRLYDSNGNFVKVVTELTRKTLVAVGCNADRLVVAVEQGNKVQATEVGP